MDGEVMQYIIEEVERQGFDVTVSKGLQRVGWMLDAWIYAMRQYDKGIRPNAEDVLFIGRMIEPECNWRGYRTCNVKVRNEPVPVEPQEVRVKVLELFTHRDELEPLQFYKLFEQIHPFVDGNGRTGKVLLNWLGGTLADPVFPPHDLFGTYILNP